MIICHPYNLLDKNLNAGVFSCTNAFLYMTARGFHCVGSWMGPEPVWTSKCVWVSKTIYSFHTKLLSSVCVTFRPFPRHWFRRYVWKSIEVKKAKLSLCLINWALCHKDIWGSWCIVPPFLTSALIGGKWSASRPCQFTAEERATGTHWIGGWVALGIGLSLMEKRKILHCRKSLPGRLDHSLSLYRLSYPLYKLWNWE
jgi:hypothetical protein